MSINGGPFVQSYQEPLEGSLGGPLPPTEDVFATVVSKPKLTRKEIDEAISVGGKGISISIKLAYSDAHGGQYESGICLLRLSTGAIEFCSSGYMN